ncbi:MAG: hypothetical protein HGA51_01690 [Demequinaceae bacterium]|nr:hypothetical protein [Demequinaceae bacterium]
MQTTRAKTSQWQRFATDHALIAEMAKFSGLSFLVAALQYLLLTFLPTLLFSATGWGERPAQFLHVSLGPIDTYVFDYPVTGDELGGLSYFAAFILMLVISQGVNFPLQRNVTFKSRGNVWFQLTWYVIALILITIACSFLMSLYVPVLKAHVDPALYNVLVTMINGGVQLAIYFPIFKIIFPARRVADPTCESVASATDRETRL